MSHAVIIDYTGISIQCQSICEMAGSQLCKLDQMLDAIEKGATKLLNSQTEALRREITRTKHELQSKINSVISQAKAKAKNGKVIVDSDFMGKHANAYDIVDEAKELERMVTRLADTKLIEMEALLNQLMSERLAAHQEKLRDLALGKVRLDQKVLERIDAISDEVMRQYVYLAWVNQPNADFDTLYNSAVQTKDKTDAAYYSDSESRKLDEIKAELKKERIDENTIEQIVSTSGGTAKERLQKIRDQANAEIVSEKVRHESVKIIVQAIKKRGFYVDNQSIKIDRANNQVNIIAMKPSGAKAEFKVYLDGRFEYRFDGYEGQACQKDIEPFMRDLEEVYGIKVVNQTEIWSNPDKNSTMKYQSINHNTNKG